MRRSSSRHISQLSLSLYKHSNKKWRVSKRTIQFMWMKWARNTQKSDLIAYQVSMAHSKSKAEPICPSMKALWMCLTWQRIKSISIIREAYRIVALMSTTLASSKIQRTLHKHLDLKSNQVYAHSKHLMVIVLSAIFLGKASLSNA